MQKWEYLTVQFTDAQPVHSDAVPQAARGLINGQDTGNQPIHEVVSKLGQEGWEMMGIARRDELFGLYLFFKRPHSDESP
jgi:hypothetical protein